MPENTSDRVLCSARPSTIAITPDVASRPRIGTAKAKLTTARPAATTTAPASRSDTMRVSRGLCSSTTNKRSSPITAPAPAIHQLASTSCAQKRSPTGSRAKRGWSGEPMIACTSTVRTTNSPTRVSRRIQSGQRRIRRGATSTASNRIVASRSSRIEWAGSMLMPRCSTGRRGGSTRREVAGFAGQAADTVVRWRPPCGRPGWKRDEWCRLPGLQGATGSRSAAWDRNRCGTR